MSDVTIHIDETLDMTALLAMQHELEKMKGVQRIDARENRPHLMVVTYDHQQTHSGEILSEFSEHGYHAELIGF